MSNSFIGGTTYVDIIVGSKTIPQYHHETKVYVEGRKGSEYKIKFRNPYNRRVLVIPSVDGLSTINGKTASSDSPGYIVPAYGQIEIPGWTIDQNKTAAFKFNSNVDSYVNETTGSIANAGVIGLMIFDEKLPNYHNYMDLAQQVQLNPSWRIDPSHTTYPSINPIFRSVTSNTHAANSFSNPVESCSTHSDTSQYRRMTKGLTQKVSNELGTGWGQSTEFHTKTVEFNRGYTLGLITIYYDSKKNLERRGIIVSRSKVRASEPNPFPGLGCTPPRNWRG